MTPAMEKIQSPSRKNRLADRWFLVILLALLLLIATRVTPVVSSYEPMPGKWHVTPSLTPTTSATPNTAVTATSTATVTSISLPTATQTPEPFSTSEIIVKVSGDYINLRTGPGLNYAVLRQVTLGEPLMLVGRTSDNTWLYVKTLDGQEGWTKATTVDLAGINLDYHPIETLSPSSETTVKVSGGIVNLRAGPGTHYSKVQQLTFGEPLILMGRLSDNTWLYVKTSDSQEGWINTTSVNLASINLAYDYYPIQTSPPTETSTPVVLLGINDRWIDIDLSEQMLYAYDGTDLVASFLVSTGIDLYPTEPGQFHIDVKWRFSDMRGDDYFLPNVPYSMYYYGDFSIHGTYWHHSFGTPMSHGCVNMDTSDAEWLYNWASVGTLVNIHR